MSDDKQGPAIEPTDDEVLRLVATNYNTLPKQRRAEALARMKQHDPLLLESVKVLADGDADAGRWKLLWLHVRAAFLAGCADVNAYPFDPRVKADEPPEPQPRPEVRAFAVQLEERLRENESEAEAGWREIVGTSRERIAGMAVDDAQHLVDMLSDGEPDQAVRDCAADVAIFAMMAANRTEVSGPAIPDPEPELRAEEHDQGARVADVFESLEVLKTSGAWAEMTDAQRKVCETIIGMGGVFAMKGTPQPGPRAPAVEHADYARKMSRTVQGIMGAFGIDDTIERAMDKFAQEQAPVAPKPDVIDEEFETGNDPPPGTPHTLPMTEAERRERAERAERIKALVRKNEEECDQQVGEFLDRARELAEHEQIRSVTTSELLVLARMIQVQEHRRSGR